MPAFLTGKACERKGVNERRDSKAALTCFPWKRAGGPLVTAGATKLPSVVYSKSATRSATRSRLPHARPPTRRALARPAGPRRRRCAGGRRHGTAGGRARGGARCSGRALPAASGRGAAASARRHDRAEAELQQPVQPVRQRRDPRMAVRRRGDPRQRLHLSHACRAQQSRLGVERRAGLDGGVGGAARVPHRRPGEPRRGRRDGLLVLGAAGAHRPDLRARGQL